MSFGAIIYYSMYVVAGAFTVMAVASLAMVLWEWEPHPGVSYKGSLRERKDRGEWGKL